MIFSEGYKFKLFLLAGHEQAYNYEQYVWLLQTLFAL